ncbi:MAG: 5-deoxy-glucuronate isomerase [Chloroflexota bacterium]|nr:5-deoxy-glucuronate isomerase [Chloroflexota bacterium]
MVDLLRRSPRIAPDGREWKHIHFEACRLNAGEDFSGDSGDNETALVILAGGATIAADDRRFAISGRADVWDRTPPRLLLLAPGSDFRITAETACEIVIAGAVAHRRPGPPRLIGPDEIRTETRGHGQTLRYVNHLLPPSADAERLILVEVFTPAGNWSSFPPHKHDTDDPPRESALEETYYYRLNPPTGFALQRIYSPQEDMDVVLAATDGDLVLVPRGYHVVANTPGHDCYYLNVMAGTGRAWNFSLDPAYAALMDWAKSE